jgi:hypothetical protein
MIELPTERSKPKSYNPKLLILLGKPKSGKSSIVASLDSNLIIDLEDGYRALSVMAVQARKAEDMFEIKEAIIKKGKEIKAMPYRFITIDNATRLEEMAIRYANMLYQNTPMGASWGKLKDAKGVNVKDPKTGKFVDDPKADIRTLPNGSGYLYLRQAVRKLIDMFKPLCETLILVTHVKDKQINKQGQELSEMTVDLAGKLGDIICGEADAIGLVYREKNKTYISFEGGDDVVREARCLHLRGKKFEVASSDEDNNLTIDMSKIFVD